MKGRILTSLLAAFVMSGLQAQSGLGAPRLVIGLTIDQLRADYVYAFSQLYGERGFKRLLNNGRIYANAEYDFINMDESSSVAAVYSGTTPYYNGIPGNAWMDRNSLTVVHSVDDSRYMGIYTSESSSPQHLLVSNVSDELMVATQGQSEIYAIAPTREMAILSAGHAAKGAFWINQETGKWCGSTFYGNFPKWLTDYNDREGLDFRINNIVWKPYLPVTAYQYVTTESKQITFKHSFEDERKAKYKKFKTSPYVNDEVNRLLGNVLDKTYIGRDDVPDFLALSYYAGNYDHQPSSELAMEIQDTYVRLDNSIAELLDLVDRKVGLNHTLVVITSTGNVDSDPLDDERFRIPNGEFYMKRCSALLNMYLMALYGPGQYVEAYYDRQIYLNHKLIEVRKLNLTEIMNRSADFILQMSGVSDAYSTQRLALGVWTPKIDKVKNYMSIKRSGDVYVEVSPGWTIVNEYSNSRKVMRHSYTNTPLAFIGYHVKPEIINTPVKVGAIAPTMAHYLRIRAPNACSVSPITDICK